MLFLLLPLPFLFLLLLPALFLLLFLLLLLPRLFLLLFLLLPLPFLFLLLLPPLLLLLFLLLLRPLLFVPLLFLLLLPPYVLECGREDFFISNPLGERRRSVAFGTIRKMLLCLITHEHEQAITLELPDLLHNTIDVKVVHSHTGASFVECISRVRREQIDLEVGCQGS